MPIDLRRNNTRCTTPDLRRCETPRPMFFEMARAAIPSRISDPNLYMDCADLAVSTTAEAPKLTNAAAIDVAAVIASSAG
ncbi:hypothetical protein [Rhodococcoides yunnanense]|uniref:hypothetical protein n=1 Tax=Rhodococcoides yunnanense TaxID=278209 RepID=UPI001114FA5E|nr:hypothetical protein [Rhodococcus yunnanensis]